MKISVSAYSYSRALSENFTLLDAIKHAKKTGFDGMEFLDGMTWGNYSDIDSMKFFRDSCNEEGLEIYTLDAGVNYLDDFNGSVERAKHLVDMTQALGAGMVRCDTIGGNLKSVGNGGIKEAIKQVSKGVSIVADYAAEKNIKLLVENHGMIMQDSIVVEELINTVNKANFGALVDIGNFMCADENSVDGVGRMARYAMHVHAKDFHFKNGNEMFIAKDGWFNTRGCNHLRGAILGHGSVAICQCLRILKNSGYKGAVSIEFEGMEPAVFAIEQSYASLKTALEYIS